MANLQITKSGVRVAPAESELRGWREVFAREHWLRLPGFFDALLLKLIASKLAETEYCVVDRETGIELRPIDCTAYLAAELLLNTPALFRAIEQITECPSIKCFSGRIYRRAPGHDHLNHWHTDVTEGRAIALSVNLSKDLYADGELQIRSADLHELLCTVPNPQYGDAIIFPIDKNFQHRISDVTGAAPKTALAGWFKSKFDPNSLFGGGRSQKS
jgi:hypothetical protein